MKSTLDFIRKGFMDDDRKLEYFENYYQELKKKIEELTKQKRNFDEGKDLVMSSSGLSLSEQLSLYTKSGWNRKEQLLDQYSELKDYITISDDLKTYIETRDRLLGKQIVFDNFGRDSEFSGMCYPRHYLVRLDEELVCMCCQDSTKNYNVSKKEVEFLTECAESQGMLIKEASYKEIPFLMNLIDEQRKREQARIPIDEVREDDWTPSDEAEERYLEDESIISNIRRTIRQAHILDNVSNFSKEKLSKNDVDYSDLRQVRRKLKEGKFVSELNYLTPGEGKKILSDIEQELESIKQASSVWFNNLLIEQCLTFKYEVLILLGNHIPTLYKEAPEEEKYIVAKAYYNMSNSNFRHESGYFKDDWRGIDSSLFKCVTADPKINQKILEMKI
jgi:hypothetical protein